MELRTTLPSLPWLVETGPDLETPKKEVRGTVQFAASIRDEWIPDKCPYSWLE